MGRTMETTRVGRALLIADVKEGIDEAEWQSALVALRKRDYELALIFGNAKLNSKQRNELRSALGDHPVTSAIVTDSILVESVVSLIGMLRQKPSRAFSRPQEALDYLKLTGAERAEVVAAANELLGRLATTGTVAFTSLT